MAHLIRLAKSGTDWTTNDLDAYNIKTSLNDAPTFFGTPDLPPPSVDDELLTTQDAENMASDRNAELIHLLDLASGNTEESEESAVPDFAVELLNRLGYAQRHRVARTRRHIPLYICGEWRRARTDVCLVDRPQNDILLLVQEHKRFHLSDPRDPRPQLIASAIAAFEHTNLLRTTAGLPPLSSQTIPGITLTGTAPTFYAVPVTAALARHIRHGTYPPDATVVSMHVPALPRPLLGMKPLDNRRAILCCYEAFKGVVGI